MRVSLPLLFLLSMGAMSCQEKGDSNPPVVEQPAPTQDQDLLDLQSKARSIIDSVAKDTFELLDVHGSSVFDEFQTLVAMESNAAQTLRLQDRTQAMVDQMVSDLKAQIFNFETVYVKGADLRLSDLIIDAQEQVTAAIEADSHAQDVLDGMISSIKQANEVLFKNDGPKQVLEQIRKFAPEVAAFASKVKPKPTPKPDPKPDPEA